MKKWKKEKNAKYIKKEVKRKEIKKKINFKNKEEKKKEKASLDVIWRDEGKKK